MDSNIDLIKRSSKRFSTHTTHPSFFSTKPALPSLNNRLALVYKIGRFIEEAIDVCYFKYWFHDVLETPFCSEKVQKSSVYVAPFLLRMTELIDEACAIDNILICMLIYIDRYFNLHQEDYLHRANFKLILMCSTWLAIKVLEDAPMNPLDFAQWVILSGIEQNQLKALELYFLSNLEWKLHITTSAYENFCTGFNAYQPELDTNTIDESNNNIEDGLRGLALICSSSDLI